jgi:hypothetical protein
MGRGEAVEDGAMGSRRVGVSIELKLEAAKLLFELVLERRSITLSLGFFSHGVPLW